MAEILDVTDASFEEDVVKSELPVLVDFWAEWCAPCHRLSPVIAQLAAEYDGKLRVAKVDVDANPEIAAKLSIRAMPTLLFFKRGEVKGSLVGPSPEKSAIAPQIDELLSV